MIAAITSTSDIIPNKGILVDINDKSCMITPENDLPEGWKRIPLEMAISMVSRSNAQWVIPNNSTDGIARVNKMVDDWISLLRSEKQEETVMLATSDITIGKNGKKSMIDVQKQRKKKNEWKKRQY